MKLWLLTKQEFKNDFANGVYNPWRGIYDMAHGAVVRAETETQARAIAADNCGDEGRNAWIMEEFSKCVELTAEGKSKLILQDYIAG